MARGARWVLGFRRAGREEENPQKRHREAPFRQPYVSQRCAEERFSSLSSRWALRVTRRGPASAPRGEAAAQTGGGRGRRGAAHLPPETRGGLRAFRGARGREGSRKAAQGEIRRGAKGSPAPRGVRRGNNGAEKLTPRWRGRARGRKGGEEKGRAVPPPRHRRPRPARRRDRARTRARAPGRDPAPRADCVI